MFRLQTVLSSTFPEQIVSGYCVSVKYASLLLLGITRSSFFINISLFDIINHIIFVTVPLTTRNAILNDLNSEYSQILTVLSSLR